MSAALEAAKAKLATGQRREALDDLNAYLAEPSTVRYVAGASAARPPASRAGSREAFAGRLPAGIEEALDRDVRDALGRRGECYLELGEHRAALADAAQLIELAPRDAAARLLHARSRAALEDWLGCIEDADAAIELLDDGVAYRVRALAKTKLGDHRGAVEDGATYVERYPGSADGWEHLGLARLDDGQYRRAIGDLESALAIDPTRKPRVAQAIAFADRIAKLTEMNAVDLLARACCEMGRAKRIAREPESAAKWFNRAIDAKADYGEAWRARGMIRYAAGRIEEARSDLTHALAETPKLYLAYYSRAFVRAKLRDFAGADADFTRYLEHSPADVPSLVYRGNVRRRLSRFPEAMADLTRALDLRPDSSVAYFFRGLTRLDLDDAAAALDDFTRALVYDARDARVWVSRARARKSLGDLAGSRADASRAIEIDATLRAQLGPLLAG